MARARLATAGFFEALAPPLAWRAAAVLLAAAGFLEALAPPPAGRAAAVLPAAAFFLGPGRVGAAGCAARPAGRVVRGGRLAMVAPSGLN